jgi:hypothetical protein
VKLKTLTLLLLASSASLLADSPKLPTLWDATVVVNDIEIPFRFELSEKSGKPEGAFFHGDERVRSTDGKLENGLLTLDFAHYATKLEAKWDGTTLTGTYGRNGKPPYAFRAKAYTPALTAEQVPSIAGE